MDRKQIKVLKPAIKQKKVLFFLLIALFLLNFVLKIFKIESIPPGATYDEIVYAAESQIILRYGTDASGRWQPWSLSPSKELYSELTSTTLIPGFLIFSNQPVLASKIIPVLMGSMIPILLALIVYYFVRKKSYLVITAMVATLNPWIFQFSRMGFDSLFSTFFYLLGIVALLYLRRWWKLFSSLAFFWGFFQYQGHKVILLPMVMLVYLTLLAQKFTKHKNNQLKKAFIETLPVLLIMVFIMLLTVNYLYRLKTMSSASRSAEFSLIDQEALANTVIEERRLAFDSPLAKIFDNKLTAYLSLIFRRFLKSFDPYLLFLRGDLKVDTFAVTDYGFLQPVDLLLICLFFLLSFTLIGTLPNLVKNQDMWITFRGSFVFLGLVMISALGLGFALDQIKLKKNQLFLVFLYLLLATPFFYTYFFKYPITQTLHKGFYQRLLANYINREPDKKFVLVTDLTTATYDYLLTYNQYIDTETQSAINGFADESSKKIGQGRIRIFETCPENLNTTVDDDTILIVDWLKEPCSLEVEPANNIKIVSLIDGGTHFSIYNDQICSQFPLQSYLNLKQNYLAVEKLDLETFCTALFVRR